MRVAIIGAGVVGLAVADALSQRGHVVWVLEKNAQIGEETSSRNSEVVHAGLYYPPDSLKARLCVEGRARLLAFCVREGVAHRTCGKLLVAAETVEMAALDALDGRARANGAEPLVSLSGAEIHRRWPELRAVAGLLSPGTAIIDSHGLMARLRQRAEAAGTHVLLRHRVQAVTRTADWNLTVAQPNGEDTGLQVDKVVNAAGLWADAVATLPGHDPLLPKQVLVKGSYFRVSGPPPADVLVYPVPSPALVGLGTHLTLDLNGNARLGPDVEPARDRHDYTVDVARLQQFLDAARRFWPNLTADRLHPAYAGIRPKLVGDGVQDFLIREGSLHGRPGWVDLLGIESPGLTASLAIGAEIAREFGR